jgi:hypothetical protein
MPFFGWAISLQWPCCLQPDLGLVRFFISNAFFAFPRDYFQPCDSFVIVAFALFFSGFYNFVP